MFMFTVTAYYESAYWTTDRGALWPELQNFVQKLSGLLNKGPSMSAHVNFNHQIDQSDVSFGTFDLLAMQVYIAL